MNLSKFKPYYAVHSADGILDGVGETQHEAFRMAVASFHLNHIENCDDDDCECEIETVDELLDSGYTIKKVYMIPEDGL